MIDLDSLDSINIISNNNNIASDSSGIDGDETQTLAQRPSNVDSASGPGQKSISIGSDCLLTCMLVTANVGTIFEESTLLELWFQQLKSYLIKIRPQLVAIHCQEVGGKNYESSMKHVSNFTAKLTSDQAIVGDYSRIRIFLDENFESLEKFTALGSLYFIHDSVKNVKLYNFKTAQYEQVEGIYIFAGESTNKQAEHVEKVKFPQDLFPECRWSRKGFMRTRWLFNNQQPLDLVNIHLFHDASNLVAMESTPSPYAQNRQRALQYALEKLSIPLKGALQSKQANTEPNRLKAPTSKQQNTDEVPLFIFGDFNFRLDTSKVIQRITEGVAPVIKRRADNDEVLEVVYHRKTINDGLIKSLDAKSGHESSYAPANNQTPELNAQAIGMTPHSISKKEDGDIDCVDDGRVLMIIGKKLFDCQNLDETFRATKNTEWLQELDNELDSFKSKLYEFKISFSPSYPFKEDASGGYSYMKTRCPAWCDRILFNAAGYRLIHGTNSNLDVLDSDRVIDNPQLEGEILYRLMGNSVPMGDHKPVLLYCQLNLSPTNKSMTNNN